MKVTSAATTFDEWLDSIEPQPDSNIFWRVGCVKMCAPRHPRFEWFLDIGRFAINDLFDNNTLGTDVITFVFPERFMGVHEQQHFTHAISKHKDVDKIKQIDLITSSPLILGGFKAAQIRILTWDDDDKHNGILEGGT